MGERIASKIIGERGKPLATTAEDDLESIRSAVRGIRYGEVRVIIQDGLIVQIEKLEKYRLR